MLNKNQKDQLKIALLQLNFTPKEIEVYISILQKRESSVITIAKDTGLSRGTVFDIIEKLKAKTFITEIKIGKRRRFIPESPTNRLYDLLDKKHEEFNKSKDLIEKILPIIKAINASEEFKPQIKVYTGEQGFKRVWEEIFNSADKTFLSFSKIETFEAFAGSDYFQEIFNTKVKKGFSSRAINQDTPLANTLLKLDEAQRRDSIIAPKAFEFPATEIIFGNKVAIFTTKEENLITVIESKDIADSHRSYFEMIWQCLTQKEEKKDD